MNKRRWEYKDCNRYWWFIEMELTDRTVKDEIDPGDEHLIWEFKVTRDNVHIYDGYIQGQYNEVPTMQDVLLEMSVYFTSVLLGMAKYCED